MSLTRMENLTKGHITDILFQNTSNLKKEILPCEYGLGLWLIFLQSRYCYVSGTAAGCKNTDKQVFISYDKPGDCRPETRERLERNARIRLSTDGCELYGRSWNKEENKPNEDELQQTVEIID